jgi:dihydroorotate dehydrogenase (NAD+) catalytic subunit
MAKAAEAAGSDALSLINTITGMKIDIHKKTFALANKTGGLSGPAIKPIAIRMVYQVANAVKIPIIGMGGASNADDIIEFMLAGATGVAIGAMNFINPYTTTQSIKDLETYMTENNIENITDLIGAVK